MAVEYHLLTWAGSGTAVTFTDAGDIVNLQYHGADNGQAFQLTTTGSLPTGLTVETTYYLRQGADENKFTIYPTHDDAIAGTNQVTFSGTGSGTNNVVGEYWASLPSSDPGGGGNYKSRYGASGAERCFNKLSSWAAYMLTNTNKSLTKSVILEIQGKWQDRSDFFSLSGYQSITIHSKIMGVRNESFHNGIIGGGYRNITTVTTSAIRFGQLDCILDGVECRNTNAAATVAAAVDSNTAALRNIVRNCILQGGYGYLASGPLYTANNNILIDCKNAGIKELAASYGLLVNNLAVRCVTGFATGYQSDSDNSTYFGNIAIDCTNNWGAKPKLAASTRFVGLYNFGSSSDEKTVSFSNSGGLLLCTFTSHSLIGDCNICFKTDGTLPTGLSVGVVYYVKTVIDVNSFTLTTSFSGTALSYVDSGSGSHITTTIWQSDGTWRILATTDFLDYANNDFRPATSSSPQVDLFSAEYDYIPLYDIKDSVRPNYNMQSPDLIDAGPFEYDHGNGVAPVLGGGLDITCESGTQIVVYTAGTTSELSRDNNSDGSFSWQSYQVSISVDVTIQKAGNLPQRYAGLTLTSVLALDTNQVVDRAYATSSGLTFGTTGTVTVGTKLLGLSAVSTGKNWYSFLIESWIAESSLRNVDFPVLHDGDESFTLLDGWEFSTTDWQYLRRCGLRYLSTELVQTATFAGLLSIGDIGSNTAEMQQSDGDDQVTASSNGDVDQLLQVYGDSTHGDFDLTDHLVIKAQINGYLTAAYDVVVDGDISELTDKLFAFPLSLVSNGLTTGDPSITDIVITDHGASPVTWNSKVFSITITDSGSNSGEDITRWINYNLAQGGTFQGKSAFNWHDLVQANGSGYKTIRGPIYGDTGAALKGVRVLRGTEAHPDFNLYTADDGTTYAPPQLASITISGATTGTLIQLYDTVADEELYIGTGPYYWSETYSADRTIRLRAMYCDGTAAKIFKEETIGSITESAPVLNYLLSQQTDAVYGANAIDGSIVTGITIDDSNLLIEVDTASISYPEIYAYETYWLSTEDGIRDEARIITAVDTANYIFSGFKIKNVGTDPVLITGGYGRDADTGSVLDMMDTTGQSIFPAPDHVVPYAAGAEATVATVQAGLSAQGYTGSRAGKIDNLDATISSVEPDNNGIAFLQKIVKNKRVITEDKKLEVYDDDDVTPILSKSLADKYGFAIADLAGGVLAQEDKSDV